LRSYSASETASQGSIPRQRLDTTQHAALNAAQSDLMDGDWEEVSYLFANTISDYCWKATGQGPCAGGAGIPALLSSGITPGCYPWDHAVSLCRYLFA